MTHAAREELASGAVHEGDAEHSDAGRM